MKNKHFLIILTVIIFCTSQCTIKYNFAGISTTAKTVSIKYFENVAPLAPVNLSQDLTESLKEIFIKQTNLNLKAQNGELNFEGKITNYTNLPITIGQEIASVNRLSITVNVKFVNSINEKDNFQKDFTRYEDYENEINFLIVEQQLVESIIEKISQDILTESIGNW